MADTYWRYGDARHRAPAGAPPPSSVAVKRFRPDYGDVPGDSEYLGYYPHEEERFGYRASRDTKSINASYDRYLQNGIHYDAGESVRPVAGGMGGLPVDDRRMMAVEGMDERSAGYRGSRPESPLPPDASSTLFVEGLPADCTRREVSHIFRPFVGFLEVRLVSKESRYPGGDPLILCFVDFSTRSQAAAALDTLQGYKFDEHDRDSANLRLQFARFSGPRSAGGPHGRR